MPTVAPQTRPAAETIQPLSKESLSTHSEASSLRKFAGIAALSMALTNSEQVNAQSQITPTPPPGHQAFINVQTPDGKIMQVPVVVVLPQGYVVAPGAQVATQVVQQAPTPQGNLPLYSAPQNPGAAISTQQPIAPQPQAQPHVTIPSPQGAVLPQAPLTIVSPAVVGGSTVGQAVVQQGVSAAPQVLTGPGQSSTIPTSGAQAQLDYSAVRIGANSQVNPEIAQARINLEAARLAEQQQIRANREAERQAIMYQREQMRYNADAQRYHYRRAQDIGWFLDGVLPSDVPGPWVKPVPPRIPR